MSRTKSENRFGSRGKIQARNQAVETLEILVYPPLRSNLNRLELRRLVARPGELSLCLHATKVSVNPPKREEEEEKEEEIVLKVLILPSFSAGRSLHEYGERASLRSGDRDRFQTGERAPKRRGAS